MISQAALIAAWGLAWLASLGLAWFIGVVMGYAAGCRQRREARDANH